MGWKLAHRFGQFVMIAFIYAFLSVQLGVCNGANLFWDISRVVVEVVNDTHIGGNRATLLWAYSRVIVKLIVE